ncbi:hypothetical protein J4558_22375 [Leptolyngbya sp. 15MV]|nr:hypothetical protein J4558_22375 [Leptolyngbya sp. 15MV]
MPRPSTAAAAAPNRISIGGAGTGVPLLPPEDEVLPLDDELLLDDEELDDVDDEELVLLVMLPELEPLVEIPPDDEDELP